jgi:hypothetical protein
MTESLPGTCRLVGLSLGLLVVLIAGWASASAEARVVFARPADVPWSSPKHAGIFVSADDGSGPRRVARGNVPMLSPDGRRIAFFRTLRSGRTDLWVVDVRSRRARRLLRGVISGGGTYTHRPVAWTLDGKSIVAHVSRSFEPSTAIVDAKTGRHRTIPGYPFASPSPGGARLAVTFTRGPFANSTGYVGVTDGRGRNRVRVTRGGRPLWGRPGLVAVTPGERILLYARPHVSRRFTVLADFSGTGDVATGVAWSREGSTLLAGRITPPTAEAPEVVFRSVVINAALGETFTFPTPLTTAYALSRDESAVLGQRGDDVVVEHRDGTVDVIASNADSAGWNR